MNDLTVEEKAEEGVKVKKEEEGENRFVFLFLGVNLSWLVTFAGFTLCNFNILPIAEVYFSKLLLFAFAKATGAR